MPYSLLVALIATRRITLMQTRCSSPQGAAYVSFCSNGALIVSRLQPFIDSNGTPCGKLQPLRLLLLVFLFFLGSATALCGLDLFLLSWVA